MDGPVYTEDDMPSDNVRETLDKAARSSFAVLEKYYSSTDQPVYAIALAMDPKCKYEWWNTARWPQDWIKEAKEQVQQAWDSWKVNHPAETPTLDQHNSIHRPQQHGTDHPPKMRRRMHPEKAPMDELVRYVHEDTIAEYSETVTNYWKRQGQTRSRLASFAKCYLSVPATSTPSERCFSRAKFFIPPSRNRLSDENLSLSILLDSFYKHRDEAQQEDDIHSFRILQ